MGLDLVEISPAKNGNPPITKILDYNKFLYEQKKNYKDQKKKQKQNQKNNRRGSSIIFNYYVYCNI